MTSPIPRAAVADNKPAFVIANPHPTHKNLEKIQQIWEKTQGQLRKGSLQAYEWLDRNPKQSANDDAAHDPLWSWTSCDSW